MALSSNLMITVGGNARDYRQIQSNKPGSLRRFVATSGVESLLRISNEEKGGRQRTLFECTLNYPATESSPTTSEKFHLVIDQAAGTAGQPNVLKTELIGLLTYLIGENGPLDNIMDGEI